MVTPTTPKLGVRLMASNDVQKEVVFNEAAVVFDTLVTRSAKAIQNAPPSSPAAGDTYIVQTGTGAWSGHNGQIALFFNGWRFFNPTQKMKFFVESVSRFYTYSGTTWAQDAAGTPTTLDDLTNVGGATPANSDVLTWDQALGLWVPKTPAGLPTLDELADVQITSILDGHILAWNASGNQWVNVPAPAGGGGATSLSGLSDVQMGDQQTGYVLTWTASGKAQFQQIGKPPMVLNDLTDVVTTGAQANDVLAWNGASWVASQKAITYSFLGMVDGPQQFDGFANHFLVVDPAETKLVFKSLDDLIASLEDFRLQDMVDMEDPTDAAVGKFIRLRKVGLAYSYEYATTPDWSVSATDNGTLLTSRILSMTFTGFDIEEPSEGHLIITNKNVLEFQGDGTPVAGDPVFAINFTGEGVNVTNIDGVLTVDVEDGGGSNVGALGDLTDVDLDTQQPVDGNVLTFDGISQTWKPKEGGVGGTPIEANEYLPATYELGPFAPPIPQMFPGRLNAPTARFTQVPARGLIVEGGPQTSGVKHALVYRNLAYDEEPWQVTARVVPASFSVAGHASGIVVQRAFNGAFVFLALGNSNSDTQFSLRLGWVSAAGAETVLLTEPNEYNWLRLGFDGNYVRAWVSSDGLIWQPFGSAVDPSTTLQGVPDRVGITNRSNATHDGSCATLVTYWEDPDFPASARTQQGTVSLSVGGLTDVDLVTAAPTTGQALVWDETESTWRPGNPTADAGGVSDLTDVELGAGPADGQTLVWNAAQERWQPGDASGESTRTIEIVTKTASHVLELSDAGKYVRMNVASSNTLTVPAAASVNFEVGTQIPVRQIGAGQTTIAAEPGVTVNTAETLKLRKRHSTITLVKVAADEWDLTGDVELAV